MKTSVFKKIIFIAAVLAALCACLPPQNSAAQTQPVSPPAVLPPDILPSSPLAQVVQLAQAGVEESVILAYINNSSATFNLTSDQIIYLKDLGLPGDAVTAMIQRDQQLGAAPNVATAPAPETTAQTETPPQPAAVTQNYFYDTLSPYGGWVNVAGYGLCWQPTVVVYDSSWQPYCDHGHWVYTDDGWYWLSDYSWGATAFHYGRWFRDPHRGWCWWPDTAWAPSWVTWRYADDYCGWAPLPPRTVYREGVGIFYNGAVVSASFDFGLGVNFFTFVPTRNFNDSHPRRYRVAPAQVTQIFNHTTVINNFNADSRSHAIINGGIPPQRITAVTRTEIRPVAIRESSAPVTRGEQLQKDTLVVNRPHFDAKAAATLNNGVRPRPVIVNGNGNNSSPRPATPAQNNFSQPNRNLNISQTQPANQTQPPRVTTRGLQDRTGASTPVQKPATVNQTHVPQNNSTTTQPVAPVVRNPQAGSPVQTPAPSYNHDERFMSPRMQQQTSRDAIPKPEVRVITPPQQQQQPQMNSAPRIEQRPNNEPSASRVEPTTSQNVQPQMNSAPRIEKHSDSETPAIRAAPTPTQNVQPRNSQPVSPAPSGQQKSGKDKDQNGPGN